MSEGINIAIIFVALPGLAFSFLLARMAVSNPLLRWALAVLITFITIWIPGLNAIMLFYTLLGLLAGRYLVRGVGGSGMVLRIGLYFAAGSALTMLYQRSLPPAGAPVVFIQHRANLLAAKLADIFESIGIDSGFLISVMKTLRLQELFASQPLATLLLLASAAGAAIYVAVLLALIPSHNCRPLPPARNWRSPKWFFFVFICFAIAKIAAPHATHFSGIADIAATLCLAAYWLQGVALAISMSPRSGIKPATAVGIALGFSVFTPFRIIIEIAGLLDAMFDFRGIGPVTPLKDNIE
ncbi:MAG TPA: DUF2232 domain-containing protein [bacterium]|nr:DUF2232 domain-containing protein [bacterium]